MAEEFKNYLFLKLQEYERKLGRRVSINEFAEYLGFSRSLVSYWLSGRIKPSFTNAEILAQIYGDEVFTVLSYAPPDPQLNYVERNWDKLTPDKQEQILKIISESIQNEYKTNAP